MEEPLTGYLTGEKREALARLLAEGRVAVLPTDTIYGFHCICTDEDAIGRIISMKGRRRSSGLILLASSVEMAETLAGRWPGGSRELLRRSAGDPLTILLPASGELPQVLRPGGKVAVRIPALEELRALTGRVGTPLISTSVNRSGQEPMTRIGRIRAEFPGLAAYISRKGRSPARPSTIVDMTAGSPVIVRAGTMSPEDVLRKTGERS